MKIIIEGSAEEIKKYRDLIGNEVSVEIKEEESYKPTKGDIVVITANTNNSRNKVGDIGKVDRIKDDIAKVDVPIRPSKASEYGNWTLFSEMRPATDEEKERYEQAVKLAKFGRQPNEFKKGDIVRFNQDTGAESFREGSIAEIETEVVGKDFRFGNGNLGDTRWIELIAPVESRVDLK